FIFIFITTLDTITVIAHLRSIAVSTLYTIPHLHKEIPTRDSYRTNLLKKTRGQFKKTLREIRLQGSLEIVDRMAECEFNLGLPPSLEEKSGYHYQQSAWIGYHIEFKS
ncbi:hypothetical protein BGW38_007413, partial [Lunasporangiospora selenospora]